MAARNFETTANEMMKIMRPESQYPSILDCLLFNSTIHTTQRNSLILYFVLGWILMFTTD